jgi:hypothetical protein
MAFLVASVLFAAPMISSLVIEGRFRPDAPLWRLRFVLVMGYTWFVPVAILHGTSFPSVEATAGLLVGSVVFGALLLVLRVQDRWEIIGEDQFDLSRPIWSTPTGDWFLRLFPFFLWALAILVSTIGIGGTALAIFLLILFQRPGLSYPLRNTGGWGGRDVMTALALFCVLLGFFAGNGAWF